ncbi:MAG: hypothetical protein JXR34_12280 [Bacteroidales bacterium]|nr:hypothetical protein [Bacteroidales bacterium]
MKISDYLKDNKGQPSSKRLISYQLIWFFMLFNSGMFPGLALLKVDINWIIALLSFDFMLLIAVFAPTQLSKIQEVKEVIQLAKKDA